MSFTRDAADIGRLLGWAARPRETPARHEDYHRLVSRYRGDADFASAVDAAFAAAGLYVTVDEREGAIVAAAPDSPLRVTLSDVMKRAQPLQRAVVGAVILAIAYTTYPEAVMLDDPDRMAVFTTRSVVDALDRAVQAHAEAATGDGGVDEEMLEAWRGWLALAPARPNAARRSGNDRPGVVARVCRLLVEAGYLTSRGDVDGGTWVARPRFRHAVAALCEDSELYVLVNGLADNSVEITAAGGDHE
ncbi:hypothetical protein CQY20_22030 [Mycolicibacterium agri]|uniref:Uncharacterized protein n=1 Tax=Mycolicibacterium agri TaxID=36811 RepID=A0A2A7MUE8_MYCAG|nr:hypothetical protein [Mycolicibacterium agri]PEG35355.1 hypothetical protein CQY20_22030 [Mycolicibacterium agri]GFG53486.1 hypothetical protein MAGR_49270 [Mycolicibacterium agri]